MFLNDFKLLILMTKTLLDRIIKKNDFNFYTSPSKKVFSEWTINQMLKIINPLISDDDTISLRNINLFIRTIIDPRIKQEYNIEEKKTAVEISLNAMKGKEEKETLEEILKKLERHKRKKIYYPYDQTTLEASNPLITERTAKKIFSYYGNEPITIIGLANGAIIAGLDLYHKLERIKERTIYFIRYSTQKSQDKKPHIEEEEKEYLIKRSEESQTIIFDEDVSSGKTILSAKEYFEKHLGIKTMIATNSFSYYYQKIPEELTQLIHPYYQAGYKN